MLLAGAMAVGAALLPAVAQEKARPYDRDLFRLSELLGAIHYLRELCSSGDGTRWRDQMEALIEAEGTSALRKVRLTKRFNKGYRSFQRTYRSCTQTAETAIARFVGEGAEIASRLIKDENDNAAPDAAAGDDG
ncbi:MAG: TIGR02301 family protein [Pseudomonadota bacterium]